MKGSIQAGKFADLVVMENDLFRIPQKDILTTPVAMTVLNGKVVFKK